MIMIAGSNIGYQSILSGAFLQEGASDELPKGNHEISKI
jgi:hypothetical protein